MDRFIYRKEGSRNEKKSTPSMGFLFNNVLSKSVLLIISVFLLYNVGHSVDITIQKLNILRRAKVEVDELRLKNLELALLLDNMQSEEYLEIQARDRLNFAGEKEYIFVIPENLLKNSEENMERLLGEGDVEEGRSSYEEWKDFLVNGI